MFLSAFRVPFSRSNWETLHRQLSWSYVCPSHEKGHTKFYPNIHERINEMLPPREDAVNVSPYVSDLTCYHFGHVTDKSHVAYRRKSKFVSKIPTTAQIVRTLLTELANVVVQQQIISNIKTLNFRSIKSDYLILLYDKDVFIQIFSDFYHGTCSKK